MRVAVRGQTLLERIALLARLAPLPALESLAGMGLSGALIAGVRLGLFERLAARPATAAELAGELSLRPHTTRLLLDALHALGYLRERHGRYTPSRRGRRWLLADSPASVAHFVASHQDYWSWWSGLTDVARGGPFAEHHGAPEGDPYWRGYITGQYELARFSAPELAKALRVPAPARRLLDVGGGHGWFAAEVCRRHPGLRATVVDLPGSTAVGRDIIRAAGYGHLVEHRDGDALTADLGEGYDVALCLNLIHHLQPDQITHLLRRIHTSLRPGGVLAVLDLFSRPPHRGRPNPGASELALLFHLSSGASLYSPGQLRTWLQETGFTPPCLTRLRRLPAQSLYVSTAVTAGPAAAPRPAEPAGRGRRAPEDPRGR